MQTLVPLRNAVIGHHPPKRLEFFALIPDPLCNLFFGHAATPTTRHSPSCDRANM